MHNLSRYFPSIYTMTKYVKESDIQNKIFYIDLIRYQISEIELVFIFYYGLSDLGRGTLKPLIEEFTLLRNLPKDTIAAADFPLTLYEESAYR